MRAWGGESPYWPGEERQGPPPNRRVSLCESPELTRRQSAPQWVDDVGYGAPVGASRTGGRRFSTASTNAAAPRLEPKPTHRRKTIASRPSPDACEDSAALAAQSSVKCSASGPASGLRREWITVQATEWRLAPSATSAKIGELQAGRRLVELLSARPVPGWCAVEPRGFVLFDALAKAPSDAKDPAKGVGQVLHPLQNNKCPEEESPAVALQALGELGENLRLREVNVSLKEQSLAARQELDAALLSCRHRGLESRRSCSSAASSARVSRRS
ncbi:unnamed protein product [Polarella glacialis]|uniref:Uncharacterized protein n=1 Tax=Polarella glacialis TaxID=89957 RepID=A0A813LG76_POLGL|nr:unnamed protein product [Polarella glacialis]